MTIIPWITACQNVSGGEAAAVGAVAFLGTGLATQVVTYSDLRVEVDVFRTPEAEDDSSFKLKRPLAATQQIRQQQVKSLEEIIYGLKVPFSIIGERVSLLGKTQEAVATLLDRSDGASPERVLLLSDLNKLLEAWDDSLRVYAELTESWTENMSDGALDSLEVSVLEARLQILAGSLLEVSQVELSSAFLDTFLSRLQGRLERLAIQESLDYGSAFAEHIRKSIELDPLSETGVEDIARAFWAIREFYRQQVSLRDTRPIDKTLKEFAFHPISGSQLVASKSFEESVKQVNQSYSPPIIRAESRKAIELIYSATLKGFNLGPLTNEAMQQILAQSDMIDIITNPAYGDQGFLGTGLFKSDYSKHWVRLNGAKSKSHLGSHNAVVYLENIATPVLKSSEFNPTDFIVANGALYRRAFDAMVSAYGMPLPGQASEGTSNLDSLNVFKIQERAAKAKHQSRKNKNAVLNMVKAAIEEQKLTKAAQKAPDKPKEWSDPAQKAAAVKSAVDRLRGMASMLEALATPK